MSIKPSRHPVSNKLLAHGMQKSWYRFRARLDSKANKEKQNSGNWSLHALDEAGKEQSEGKLLLDKGMA